MALSGYGAFLNAMRSNHAVAPLPHALRPSAWRRALREYRALAHDPALLLALIIATLFVLIAVTYPLGATLAEAASPEGIRALSDVLRRPVYHRIILNTLVMGLTTAAIGTAVGFLFAYVRVKVAAPNWIKQLIHLTALVPVVSPPFAVAIAIIVLFGRSGFITYSLLGLRPDIYGLPGLTMAMVLSFFTVAYLNLAALMEGLDPALDEAAANIGASKWHIFRTVTLPLLMPGIAGSFLLLFVEALADLGNPLVLGGNYTVLATRLYLAIVGEYDITTGAVLSIILLVPSVLLYFLQLRLVARASVVTITGKPSGRAQPVRDRRVVIPLVGAALAIALLIALIYLTILAGAFTISLGANNAFTLRNFEYVLLGYGAEAMFDTTGMSVIATLIAGLLSMVIAFLVVRGKFAGRNALDLGTMLGIAVPGTIFGIGYLLAFNSPTALFGIPLIPKLTGGAAVLGGALAIVMVYVIRSTPAGLRSGVAALQQIDPAIEEASVSIGADQATTFRRITLPLVRPALLTAMIYAFARSMTTVSAILFLTTPQTRIMTQQILNETEAGRFGNAFAYVVVLIAIVLIAIGILFALIGSRSGAARDVIPAQPIRATLP
ncbi:MAG: iron ABC transporter permease [Candidatus Roseilinea sp.]|nr:MAG: iron ABC transporter permease [Candidatus Roseilinea sp.]